MKIILDGKTAARLLPFAKKKLGYLDSERCGLGLDVMTRRLAIGESLVLLCSASYGNKIEIFASSFGLDNILFYSLEGKLYGYNWETDKYEVRGVGGSGYTQGIHLRLEKEDQEYYLCSSGRVIVKSSPVIIARDTAIYYSKNAVAQLFANTLQLRFNKLGNDIVYTLAELQTGFAPLHTGFTPADSPISMHGDLVGATGVVKPDWNSLERPELTLVSAVEGGDSYPAFWRWTPKLWHPSPDNPLDLEPGIYYGSPSSWYGPYKRAHVNFCGLLYSRGGGTPFGYAEGLFRSTRKDGSEDKKNIVFFSFTPWEADKDFYLSWTGGYQKTRFFQHNYWETTPREDFAIDYGVAKDETLGMTQTPKIDWWSAKTIMPTEENGYSDTIDITCVVATNNGFVRVNVTKRIGGRGSFHVESIGIPINAGKYHSHSVSANGQILALFFWSVEETIIDNVVVYDFSKSFVFQINKPMTDEAIVLLGKRKLWYGQIIPVHENPKISDSIKPAWHGKLSISEYRKEDYDISMFGMRHPMPTTEGYDATGWQVNITGTEAVGFLWEDDCWESNRYTEVSLVGVPPLEIPQIYELKNLILYNYDPSIGLNNVYGTGKKKESGGILPLGVGTTIERADIFIHPWLVANTNCLSASKNSKAPIEWSGDVRFDPTNNCYTLKEVCSEAPVVKIRDSCGKSASQEFEYLLDPVEVTGDNLANVGEFYQARGGIGPYEYSFSAGSISEEGEILSLSDCSDLAGVAMAEVTATDSCGNKGILSVRLPSGQWVLKQDKGLPSDLYWIDRTIVSGATKTMHVYRRAGSEYSDLYQYCNSGDCLPVGRENTCEGEYVCSAISICGQTPSRPMYTSGLGPYDSAALHSSGDYPCVAQLNDGHCYSRIGWNCYAEDSNYGRVYEWECP